MIKDNDSDPVLDPGADKPAEVDSPEPHDPDALLERQIAEATAAALPRAKSLRAVVRLHGGQLRELVMATNDWTRARNYVEQRLGRGINLRSLQTYLADLYPQKAMLRASEPQPQGRLTNVGSEVTRAETVRHPQPQPLPQPKSHSAVGEGAGGSNPFAPRLHR